MEEVVEGDASSSRLVGAARRCPWGEAALDGRRESVVAQARNG
jgi:hypothetical protein